MEQTSAPGTAAKPTSKTSPTMAIYCALCAVPCLSRDPENILHAATNAAPHAYPSVPSSDIVRASRHLKPTDPTQKTEEWLYSHTTLDQLTSSAFSPSPTFQLMSNHRVTIHTYCLSSAVRLQESAHDRRMLQTWALPRWTGWTAWDCPVALQEAKDDGEGVRRLHGPVPGRWKGLKGQTERWLESGMPYLSADRISPLDIPPPSPSLSPFDISTRPQELNRLATLPPHIMQQIASNLLDPPEARHAPHPCRQSSRPPIPILGQSTAPHPDFLSLLNTSATIRYFHFPDYFWGQLVRESVQEFQHQLMNRWGASPGRAISLDRITEVLQEEFATPVETVLEEAQGSALSDEAEDGAAKGRDVKNRSEYTAREVFFWWTFDLAWRSRRRVWRCVVYGSAQARDADWL